MYYYLHQLLTAERTLQSMLGMLNERKELDVQFMYEEGEDGSGLGSFIFVP